MPFGEKYEQFFKFDTFKTCYGVGWRGCQKGQTIGVVEICLEGEGDVIIYLSINNYMTFDNKGCLRRVLMFSGGSRVGEWN